MKVAHFTFWAPRRSGMYESVKDQIKYERKEGLESHLVDPNHEKPDETLIDDGWLTVSPWELARECDIWVLHGKIPNELDDLFDKKVTVAVLHGPNESLILKEWAKQNASFNTHISILWKYDATVTLNQHEYDIMRLYDEKTNRCHYIPNSIDLERYPVAGDKWVYHNRPAIGSFDVNRLEKLPVNIIWAMPKVCEKVPKARLNMFSLSLEQIGMFRNIYCRSYKRALQGEYSEMIQLENMDLRSFMRGIDIGFNSNISGIASRVTMEMMAMGVPVVSYGGNYTNYVARIWDLDSIAQQIERCWKDLKRPNSTLKGDVAKYAKTNFDRSKEVKKYVKLYQQLMEKKHG